MITAARLEELGQFSQGDISCSSIWKDAFARFDPAEWDVGELR
jgi:hypothetical protein